MKQINYNLELKLNQKKKNAGFEFEFFFISCFSSKTLPTSIDLDTEI